jgi:hypothetical protein
LAFERGLGGHGSLAWGKAQSGANLSLAGKRGKGKGKPRNIRRITGGLAAISLRARHFLTGAAIFVSNLSTIMATLMKMGETLLEP